MKSEFTEEAVINKVGQLVAGQADPGEVATWARQLEQKKILKQRLEIHKSNPKLLELLISLTEADEVDEKGELVHGPVDFAGWREEYRRSEGWFAVRCIIRDKNRSSYEERIVIVRAADMKSAVEKAEADAQEYAKDLTCEYINYADAFHIFDSIGAAAEVFSLIRESDLEPDDYIDHFFDTGKENRGAGLLVLRPAQAKSLNVRGAYLEVSVTSSVRWLSSPPLC